MNLFKEKLASENLGAKKRMSEGRMRATPEKKAHDRLNAKKQMSELRMQATPEKKAIELLKAKERMTNFRAQMDPLKTENYKLMDRERKMPVRKVLTFEDSKIKEIGLSNRIKAFKNQIIKGPFFLYLRYLQ